MIKRIVEIGHPARLSIQKRQMVIDREGMDLACVPIEDLGVLILDHAGIQYTQALLVACFENNVAVLICDGKHLPGALLMPLYAHSLHTKTIAWQVKLSEPVCKRLWRTIVQTKIREQAKVLHSIRGDGEVLRALSKRVKSGDPDNFEAQAAKIYWNRLFGDEFRRRRSEEGINTLLNYGYSIIRAAIARSVLGAGLHPSLGIHHRNQYNAFCLVDDLIEPLRPLIDIKVYELINMRPGEITLDKENKRNLLELLSWTCTINDQRLPLMVALHHYAASIRRVILGEAKQIEIPEL